jgi:hypothetical protein
MVAEQDRAAVIAMKASDVTGGPDGLQPLEDAEISELRMCLLVQAFGGRSIRYVKIAPEPVLIVAHDHVDMHCDLRISEEEFQLLERDLDTFEKTIAAPMISNLEECAAPERWERYIAAVSRIAELILQRPAA